MSHNDWDQDPALGAVPPGMPEAPRFPPDGLRYGDLRDNELTTQEQMTYGDPDGGDRWCSDGVEYGFRCITFKGFAIATVIIAITAVALVVAAKCC